MAAGVNHHCSIGGQISRRTHHAFAASMPRSRGRDISKSEDDKVKDALQMYKGIVGCQFKFVHCWFMLQNEAKWNNWLASLSSPSNAKEVRPTNATKDEMLPHKIDRHRAKKQWSSSNSSNSNSTTCLEVLQKMQVNQNAFDKRVEAASKDEVIEIVSRGERKLNLMEHQLKAIHGSERRQDDTLGVRLLY
jgi:hypothetical protein